LAHSFRNAKNKLAARAVGGAKVDVWLARLHASFVSR